MNLNPLASVFVPQSSAKAIQPPLDSMAPTVSNSFHFNAEAEEFVPILPHIEESVSDQSSRFANYTLLC